jgi:MoaA/NifB/PqqE/SkfB family radical SAM enzyme
MRAAAPETIFFSITDECPLRCRTCSMWDLRDPPESLTERARLEIVDRMEAFQARVHVVITGGEPFTKYRHLREVARRLRAQGNSLSVVTSGLFLKDAVVQELEGSGISHLALSLDYPSAAQHDAQRGIPGLFDRAVSAARTLRAMREGCRDVPTVGINTIVMAPNVNYLTDVARLAADLGACEILFQPIQPDFALAHGPALQRFRHWLPLRPQQVDQALDDLEALRGSVPLGQSKADLDQLRAYFRRPLELAVGVCKSPRINLVIDVAGTVSLCFGQARTGVPPLGRVPTDDIVALWHGEVASAARARLAQCTHGCGMLLCHARSSVPASGPAPRAAWVAA